MQYKLTRDVIFNAGIYDCLHEGHYNLLKAMKGKCKKLIVVLHDDYSTFLIKKKFPIQKLSHRMWNLYRTGLVDDIIVTRSPDPSLEFAKVVTKCRRKKNQFSYFRGDDLTENFPGQHYLKRENVEICFLPYTKGVSSTLLRQEYSVKE